MDRVYHNQDKLKINQCYWDEFYKTNHIHAPSSFFTYTKDRIPANAFILDIGCGSGRDSFAFFKNGHSVIGIDRSKEAIHNNRIQAGNLEKTKEKWIEFENIDLNDKELLAKIINRITLSQEDNMIVLYTRFLLHSIPESTETIFFQVISEYLPKGSYFFSEFRTNKDKDEKKIYDNHYRRFINIDKLIENLRDNYHFRLVEYSESKGLSIYKGEDPYLGRIMMLK